MSLTRNVIIATLMTLVTTVITPLVLKVVHLTSHATAEAIDMPLERTPASLVQAGN